MDNNHTDDYVLVLEDRTEVKNEAEVDKLSVVSDIDEKGTLKTAPAEEAQQSSFLRFSNKDGLPQQKNTTAINPEQIDWKLLETLGLSREKLEQSGELDKMRWWQKRNLLPIAIPVGDSTVYTEARLAFRTDDNGNIGLAVHSLRKEPQLDFPYMGHKFSAEEKETLLATGTISVRR